MIKRTIRARRCLKVGPVTIRNNSPQNRAELVVIGCSDSVTVTSDTETGSESERFTLANGQWIQLNGGPFAGVKIICRTSYGCHLSFFGLGDTIRAQHIREIHPKRVPVTMS